MTGYPFTQVVGQDDVKLALLLNAVDPRIGGVLLRGEKGSGKSTLARSLAGLLPAGAPFVDLPVGATEDRVVGTLDLAGVLEDGQARFQPGLLAAVDGGVLYIDEVNLLPDHLVDVLLDVAASGVNRVERDGFSHVHRSRFVLVGSMNPEEGDLRPQLLDRFGLSVQVAAPTDPAVRAEVVRRRLDFDRDPDAFARAAAAGERTVRESLAAATPAATPDDVIDAAARVSVAAGAEGLRADLVITRAAAALAGLEGRDRATVDDVRRVAPLALSHRRRRTPFDDHGVDEEEIERALSQHEDQAGSTEAEPPQPHRAPGDRVAEAGHSPRRVVTLGADRLILPSAPGRRSQVDSTRGRHIGDRPRTEASAPIAARATVAAAATRSARTGSPLVIAEEDLRESVRVDRAGNLVVLAVDASGSMGAQRRMEAVKGTVLALLLDAYQRRDRVALVTFRDDEATVTLRPTGSVEVARTRLAELPTGGRTPLADGIDTALRVARSPASATHQPLLVLISDCRATSGPDGDDPMAAALRAAAAVRTAGVRAVVVDAEDAPARLGLARRVADAMGARYLRLPELSADALTATLTKELA